MFSTQELLFETESNEGAGYYTGLSNTRYKAGGRVGFCGFLRYYAVSILLGIVYILVIVLFALVSESDSGSNYYLDNSVVSSLSVPSAYSHQTVAMSIDESTGSLQIGAGTSIYKDILSIPQSCASYLDMIAVLEGVYLVSYASSSIVTLDVVTVGPQPNKGTLRSTTTTTTQLYQLEALDVLSGLFVGITQDVSDTENTCQIVAGSVDSKTFSVTLGTPVGYSTAEYSLSPQITRLSDTTFAFSYYYDLQVMVAYGVVDPQTLAVTLSTPVPYADNSNYDVYMSVVGLSPSVALLFHYQSTLPASSSSASSEFYTGPLNATIVYIESPGAGEAVGTVRTGTSTSLPTSSLSYYLKSTRIDNSTAVVAFIDTQTNFGISCILVRVTSEFSSSSSLSRFPPQTSLPPSSSALSAATTTTTATGQLSVVFGSLWTATTGETLTITSRGVMDLDLQTIDSNGRFLLFFSDISNGGAMTAIMAKVSATEDITRESPNLVINKPNLQASQAYYWGALAAFVNADTIAFNAQSSISIQVAILSGISEQDCTQSEFKLANLHMLPAPIGIAQNNELIMSGSVGKLSKLVAGKVYFTNTLGELIGISTSQSFESSNLFYGSLGNVDYVEVVGSNLIVSLGSQVGVAVSESTLLVSLVNQF